MLVFLLFAVLSFVVARVTKHSAKEKVSEEMQPVMLNHSTKRKPKKSNHNSFFGSTFFDVRVQNM